jgi:chromosome segregation ATPase
MKKIAVLFATSLLLLLQAGGALAQTSDYEIIQSFKQKRDSLLESVKTAQNMEQCVGLEGEIGRLEGDYGQHRKLLADGLHPQTLDTSIAALREQLQKTKERIAQAETIKKNTETIGVMADKARKDEQTIATISKENAEFRAAVEKLSQEVQQMSSRIEQLSTENTGLVEQIRTLQAQGKKDQATIAELKKLNEKLNENIRNRDELIIRMMDSFIGEYSKAGLTDAQRKDLFVNAQGNDYVGKIISTIDENVKYAEATILTAEGAKGARDEQKKLSAKWEELKPYIGKLYADEQIRTRDLATVDGRLADWKRNVDSALWKSLQQVFAAQNVDIGQFRNGGEFSAQLLSYIDRQIDKPSRETYQNFRRHIWDTPIKDTWLPIISMEELSQQQRADIEAKIALWEKKISALLLRWVLIGGLGVAVVAVILVVSLRKKKPAAPASAA